MKKTVSLIASLALVTTLCAQNSPKYKADIPSGLLTPDKVQTKLLGELNFTDGMPSDETVKKAYDFLDTARASEAFLNTMPAISLYAMFEGLKQGGAQPGDLIIFDNLIDARTLYLTAQTTTPYGFAEINVKDEPMIVEMPPFILGAVDDAAFLHVTDIGITGPDKGKGGKYLFVGPDYKGEIPKGYIVARTKTYRNWIFMRTFVKDGDIKGSIKGLETIFNIYPLSKAKNPPKQKLVSASGKQFNTIHSNDITYYDELNALVQYEPADIFNPETTGLISSLGIKKGKKFNPDARMKKILTDGIAIGNATARAITFRPRNKNAYYYPGERQWYTPFSGGSSEFRDGQELVLDDRTMFHYYATAITPAMAMPMVGKGSAYAIGAHDSNGNYLDGSKTYSVTLPAPVPAKDFWSFMVYDNHTRSILETDQIQGGLDSKSKDLKLNKDGSATVYFGPSAPKGKEGNWVQTISGKGYNVLLRIYGPLKPWFDKTWKPGDFELVK
jgi:hypothetical protein